MAKQPINKPKHSKAWLALIGLAAAALVAWAAFSVTKDASLGKNALQDVTEIVAFGPRPPASDAHRKMEHAIVEKLRAASVAVEEDRFSADTPVGKVPMNNIIARIPGSGGAGQRTIVVATHYDTKLEDKFTFVGANDGGSGTGLLLALAPVIAKRGFRHNVWLVFLDGEEAIQEWSDQDSLAGSKRFAAQLKAQGIVKQIGAFILLDMIGDADLGILRESNSTAWLRDLVWKAADRLGYSRNFLSGASSIEDDHIPLLQAGVPSVDLIDTQYGPAGGPFGAYWHSAQDTIDKLSAQSLQIVGDVVLETISELDKP